MILELKSMNTATTPVCDETSFVGNRRATTLDLIGPDMKTLREKYMIGEPRDCPMGTGERMKRLGFVGIYEREPQPAYLRRMDFFRRRWIE